MLSFVKAVTLSFILSFLCFKLSDAQLRYDFIRNRIDSLADIGLPKSALEEVDRLDEMSRKDKNAPQQVRAVIYRMTFQSYLEEDALAAIISRLKTDIDRAGYPVKPVLQSLLAQMYFNYYQQNRYRFNQRTKLVTPDADFTNWDLQTIIDETSRLYSASLNEDRRLFDTPVGVLNGVLEGDSSTRYLRPTLYDLLVNRAFDFFLTDEAGLNKPRLPFSLNDPEFFSDSRTFAQLQIKTTDTGAIAYKGIKYLQQATRLHLQNNDMEALADLDLKRLSFLYDKSTLTEKDSLYLTALKQIAVNFKDKPVSATAIQLEGKYYQNKDSLVTAYSYYRQAVASYPNSLGGKNAATLIRQVEQKEVGATLEDLNMPAKPILALIKYRNVKALEARAYRLSQKQLEVYLNGYTSTQNPRIYQLSYLKVLKPVQTINYTLPDKGDYLAHTAEFKIDPLSAGNYVLLVKDPSSADSALMVLANFKVSGMAYTARKNPDDKFEIRAMNRETGKPLSGVTINLSGQVYQKKWINITDNGTTDKNGLYITEKFEGGNQIGIELITKGDTLSNPVKYIQGEQDNTADDDEIVAKTIIFTDRQIYRPGQTIYFNGLQLQTFKGKSKIMPGKDVTISFNDVNGKQVSSLDFKTNDFGTFSGSFIIPQTMLNGNVELSTADGSINVKVEEYKRPNFQVAFLPVKDSYKLNDPVTVSGNVRAFAGYGISAAKVAFHITRSQNQRFEYGSKRYNYGYIRYNNQTAEIAADTITTDNQGNFKVKFKAVVPDAGLALKETYTYNINADVTDATGETHSAETAVKAGNNDIEITGSVPQTLFAKDSLRVQAGITNLNGQLQAGDLKVDIYALKDAGQVFKNRLWGKPDAFILNRDDFKKSFPDYAWNNEDVFSSLPRENKVIGLNFHTDTLKPEIVNLEALKKVPSGIYQVVISARNQKGDTTSSVTYVNFIKDEAKPTSFDEWLIPVTSTVKPGEDADFLLGIDKKINVLMERYQAAKLISSEWITVESGQKHIKVPVSVADKNISVQFMMVYNNRFYSSYQHIFITLPDSNLKLKFLTYRNKLQPGEKEQWKIQVSNTADKGKMTEMIAGLYDASLDDITPPADWNTYLNQGGAELPAYFNWYAYDFIQPVNTDPVNYPANNFTLLPVNYERLDLFGYNYYGGYNNGYQQYLQHVNQHHSNAAYDKQLKEQYLKNAAKIKDGIVISGKVVASDDNLGIPGVTVKIKGFYIGTLTDARGNFKLKVPKNATLIISFIGYITQNVPVKNELKLNIKLEASHSALNEVVVVGYGTQRKKDITGAVATVSVRNAVKVRTADSEQLLEGKAAGVTVINQGAPGAASTVFIRGISNFGSNAPKPIALRTNFNETAFFYPQLRTNEKGEILIDFTISEALTRWKFRGFAHTKDLRTGYIENTVITQKQLSISANMPRFLREGDTVTVSARLANLSSGALKGKIKLQLLNALNMQPVDLLINKADAEQSFAIAANLNKSISFRLLVPAGLDALIYRLTADAGQYNDGEENTVPVLPNRTLVTESMPMMVRAGQTRNYIFEKLVNQNSITLKNKTLTLEYTLNPAWYAVKALPYLMEYPYECSEQVFSRYFANSMATNIIEKRPAIKQVFDRWKSSNSSELLSNLEKNQELKEILIEETPWLKDAMSETEQKKRIALLFDMNKMSSELHYNLGKLQKSQLPNGGFPWFGGEYADRYITQYIIAGIGELNYAGIMGEPALAEIADKSLTYLDNQLIIDAKNEKKLKNYTTRDIGELEIHAWYARSFFTGRQQGKAVKTLLADYLKRAAEQWKYRNVYEQGMIALTMQRFEKPDVAQQIERSLLETAQHSDELGMYWPKNREGYFWYEAPVETQSLLIELFTEAGSNAKAVDEMKIWLLRNKQTSDWRTTKATASACYALLLKGSDMLNTKGTSAIMVNGKPLEELKPDIKADAGTDYIKTSWADEQVKPAFGKVEIRNNSTSVSWGAMHWQYLENLDKITASKTNIALERHYFIQKQTDAGPVINAVDATHQPKTGDLLKVVVHLKADRDFEYIQLKDMRPAGTEPVDALSAYKYQDGLYYYQVSRDVATNFFISYLNKGNYVFEYQLRVAQPGNFSTGITSVQCMYAPEFNAHSPGERMTIKP